MGMIKSYFNELKKHKILLIALLMLIAIGFLGAYSFNKIKIYYYDYKFEKALKEAAKIDPSSWDEKYQNMAIKDKYKVVIVTNKGGEYSYAEYFKYAGERMGWEVNIYVVSEFNSCVRDVIEFDPDFMLVITRDNSIIDDRLWAHDSKKYLIEMSPLRFLRDYNVLSKGSPYKVNSVFSGLINKADAILISAKEVDYYRIIVNRANKLFNGLMILPLAPTTNYNPAEPKGIVWFNRMLGDFTYPDNYQRFIKLLSENVPMKVYGKNLFSTYLAPGVYDGYIPSANDILPAIRQNGIYLLTHADRHIKEGVPTLRIFEAVSANAVVISDKHPFSMEHFGDSFLYFDQNSDGEAMYKQVKAHFDWIQNNPEKAKSMADRAHKIFLEKFTLEKDLIRIAKMHEYIRTKEKEMKLSYPLVY